ncbi:MULTISPECIES: amino acid synthesis family protein [Glutamicibacter]|uniref:amino acid synthesis family protein n=1 Tax=Glutamicibacter TaxID=1742989 RepID=UPI000A04B2D7|nr:MULTISPECIES: amino acid synthesis family protein [Glutamicibacter]QEP08347.1 amino acid synthesis family protein [Glutamicibacter sp. ZJUTW]WIV43576.1 amino acid synthesis family protein [Glutamicibacter nicotianae]
MNSPLAQPSQLIDLSNRSTLDAYEDLARAIGLRKISCTVEELPHHELGAITRATATAVIPNPWLGTGTSQDLSKRTEAIAPLLAKLLSDRLLHALGGAEKVEAFGKAALVGSDGELEHAGALIHTPFFGNLLREALGGTSIICFVDGRGVPGESLRVPMWHKTAAATRTHYQTLELSLPDAPHAGEIAVIAAASTGPRPHARIGDRTTDQVITSEILKGIQL